MLAPVQNSVERYLDSYIVQLPLKSLNMKGKTPV